MNPNTPQPLNRPGQPVNPMQGPPGHGNASQHVNELPGSWEIDKRSVPRMPPDGALVKAVPYEIESGVGKQSGIPYHRVNFRIIEGEFQGYDRLNFLVSEVPKASFIAEKFFDDMGYPIEVWPPAHKKDVRSALKHVVQQGKAVLLRVKIEEGPDDKRYRKIAAISQIDTMQF